jgi:glycine C-acetyltransferase
MAGKIQWIHEELQSLKESGLYNNIRTIQSPQGAWLEVDGKHTLNFCSNNYLGLANHPKLVAAAKSAIDRYGVGPAAVRTIAGTMALHTELEARLAAFKGVESAITFQSGFNANLATIPALVGKGDVIFSDELNHASIIDGSRLSGAKIIRYKHCDAGDLKSALQEHRAQYPRALIVTDGVFSMDGDVAPLDDIYTVSGSFNAILMVDDAHGEGVLGKGGRGIVDHFGLHGKVILEESTELVDKLWENARYFKEEMKNLGFDTGQSVTPITPVMLGEASLAQQFSRELFSDNVFAMAIGFPTVPRGKARIRVMISAAHTKDDLDRGLEAFGQVGRSLGVLA